MKNNNKPKIQHRTTVTEFCLNLCAITDVIYFNVLYSLAPALWLYVQSNFDLLGFLGQTSTASHTVMSDDLMSIQMSC